jgi:hypothetical protein
VTASFLVLTPIIIAVLRFRRRQQFAILQQVSLRRSEDRFRTLTLVDGVRSEPSTEGVRA